MSEDGRPDSAYPAIGDHALIGDCRTAALVNGRGTIDWLCAPRFDGPPVFSALLDAKRGGTFRFGPRGSVKHRRRYVEGTPVLETIHTCRDGVVRVRDHMPVADEAAKGLQAWPDVRVVRIARCLEGTVELELECDPRPDFGRRAVRTREGGGLGWWFEWGDTVAAVAAELPLDATGHGGVQGSVRMHEGDTVRASFALTHALPGILPPLGRAADQVEEESRAWWRRWLGKLRYDGPYRDAVERSALTLKLLTYAPSGAVIAAPTTSLPEAPGGSRNWDYRYCWLRDASWTYRALADVGYTEEATAFFQWMLHATRRTLPEVRAVYDVFGRPPPPERVVADVEGYAGSSLVRVGNAAREQLQLDVYGEILLMAFDHAQKGGELDRSQANLLNAVGDTIIQRWEEPDEGIWEVRGERRRHTHSAAVCWAGLDRLARLKEEGTVPGPAEPLRTVAAKIRADVEGRAVDPASGAFRQTLDGGGADAALLQLPLVGFVEPDDPRAVATYERVRRELGRNGLLLRYPPGSDVLGSEEGAFAMCTSWEVEYLARRGAREKAAERLDGLLARANEVGLLAEEIDPETGAALGNFPQAYTHVGVINAALALEEAEA